MSVCDWAEWGVSISQQSPRKTWVATFDTFFDIIDYFTPPERELVLITRSELEGYIKETIAFSDSKSGVDEEFEELKEFFADSVADTFYLYAEW